jgi:hypothetical protein
VRTWTRLDYSGSGKCPEAESSSGSLTNYRKVAISTAASYKLVTEYGHMFKYEEVLSMKSFLWTVFAVLS